MGDKDIKKCLDTQKQTALIFNNFPLKVDNKKEKKCEKKHTT